MPPLTQWMPLLKLMQLPKKLTRQIKQWMSWLNVLLYPLRKTLNKLMALKKAMKSSLPMLMVSNLSKKLPKKMLNKMSLADWA